MTEPLSPAAQAVLNVVAADAIAYECKKLAAALRAVAGAIEPIDITPDHQWLLEQLRDIAAELEAQ